MYFVYMCVHHVNQVPTEARSVCDRSSGTGVIGGCDLPDTVAGIQKWIPERAANASDH